MLASIEINTSIFLYSPKILLVDDQLLYKRTLANGQFD